MKRILVLLALVTLASCSTHTATAYKVSTAEKNCYCDHPTFTKDTVRCVELLRNGKPNEFKIPYGKVESVTFRGKKYNWK